MAEKYEPKLGKIIEGQAWRDAVHVAVAPLTAALEEVLLPGQHVGLDEGGRASWAARPLIGVVDPFLTVHVKGGEKCWVLIYPNTIVGLRHVWQHPAFKAKLPEAK